MESIFTALTHHIDVVYFLYGLAFYSMGLAVLLESGRSSEFRLARAMGSLAGFGILHGIHEWMEMFQRLGKFDDLEPDQLFFLDGIRIGILLLSFLMLVIFGFRLVYSSRNQDSDERPFAYTAAGLLALFWLGSVFLTRWVYQPTPQELVRGADVLARYIGGIPGAALAAWAIILEQRAFQARNMADFGRALWWAALAILLYGVIGQSFPNASFLFPANFINADLFMRIFGVPVQVFRSVMAMLIAVFVIRALRAFELESQQRLAKANEAKLIAQEQALTAQEQARTETEQLNLELQTAVQDLSMLFEVSRNLSATLDKERLLQDTLLQIADNLPHMEGGLILLRDKPGRPLELTASYGYQGRIRPRRPTECTFNRAYLLGEYVANTGQLALCTGNEVVPLGDRGQFETNREEQPPLAQAHTLGVPLVVQEQVAGSLVLSATPETRPFTNRDISLLSTVGGQLSIALENAILYQEVQAREILRGKLLHQIVSAQEKERQRIARELHDGTGQTLTALGLGLAAVNEAAHDNPTVQQLLHDLRMLSASALQEVHDVIADLRPSVLDNLGLAAALRSQVQAFETRTGVQATLTLLGERHRLHSDLETVIFRIAQEALTNVTKHAKAKSVQVRLAYYTDRLEVEVKDDGRGFDPRQTLKPNVKQRQAWGLLGMQERVALVGGQCNILSEPGEGTTILVSIPLAAEEVVYAEDQVDAG